MFPLVEQSFEFVVFRQVSDGEERPEDRLREYRLPDDARDSDDDWGKYWISFDPREGFDKFVAKAHDNRFLTLAFISHCLRVAATSPDINCEVVGKFKDVFYFILETHPQGKSCIRVSPYYCRIQRAYGLLADFAFRRNRDQPLDREVLRLSHSLDSRYRENTDYYATRYSSLQRFIEEIAPKLFPPNAESQHPLTIKHTLQNVASSFLKTKLYVSGGTKPVASQFMALKQHGPFRPITGDAKLCFMYRPDDKPLSHDLYRALRGDTYPTFPGMERMFHFPLGKENVFGIPIEGYSHAQLKKAAHAALQKANGALVEPVVLVPWSRQEDGAESDDAYYTAKHAFLSAGLPSQFVSIKTIRNKATFKWSISNLGTAVFAKLGGKPWKVVSDNDDCLIVGIGQAHRKLPDDAVSRYYSYCVLTDSSGVYEDLKVLSHEVDHDEYLNGLTNNLLDIFRSHSDSFSRFAIHTPFKLRHSEMDAIRKAIAIFRKESDDEVPFAVLKFNARSDFMGFSMTSNSRVPFESTMAQLSFLEYLVWFEGLQFHKQTVERRYSRPVHVEFIYPRRSATDDEGKLSIADKEMYLQDALNLSGANWRGFNAKSLPVSIFYARLIAKYFSHFERLELEEFDIENLTPWFL